jgi:hypothetical protein
VSDLTLVGQNREPLISYIQEYFRIFMSAGLMIEEMASTQMRIAYQGQTQTWALCDNDTHTPKNVMYLRP